MTIHDILVAGGINVLDARVDPRPGSFSPIGVMVHHTANPQHGDLPSLHLLQHGRPDLAGPLVQLGAGREGTIASITDGRANHAGKGSDVVAARVRADVEPAQPGSDNTDGNTLFIGIEIENAGDGHDPYPARQLDHVVDTCVALCIHFGWSANRVIGHKEWTRRKPDPTLLMGNLRSAVHHALNPPPTPQPEEDMLRIVTCRDHGGTYLTNCIDSVRTLSQAALIHGRNLGFYPKDEIDVPHEWIVWVDQAQDGHHNPAGV